MEFEIYYIRFSVCFLRFLILVRADADFIHYKKKEAHFLIKRNIHFFDDMSETFCVRKHE